MNDPKIINFPRPAGLLADKPSRRELQRRIATMAPVMLAMDRAAKAAINEALQIVAIADKHPMLLHTVAHLRQMRQSAESIVLLLTGKLQPVFVDDPVAAAEQAKKAAFPTPPALGPSAGAPEGGVAR